MKNLDFGLLIAFISLLVIGSIWGTISQFTTGWDKVLTHRETFNIWLWPFITCIIPGFICYIIFTLRNKK